MHKKVPTIVKFYRIYFNTIGIIFPAHSSRLLHKLFSTPRKRVLKKHELDQLKQAKKSFIDMNGSKIKVYEWGKGDRLAFLFHGWETNAGSLGAFIDPLLKLNYKVISFDAPAHGGSTGKRANLIFFKRTAKLVIHKFGVPHTVIGHSLGANSILMTALEEDLTFEKTVLVAPLNRLMSVFEEMKSLLKIPDELFNRFIKDFEQKTGYPFHTFNFHDYGKKSKLKNVLLLHDQNDRVTNFQHALNFEREWKEIKLIPMQKSGHYKILWNQEVINKTISYLKE